MAIRTVTWSTIPFDAPAGTVGGNWLVTMTGQPEQSVPAPVAIPYTLGPGDYVCTVQRLDDGDLPIGPLATASFTIAGTVAIDVPSVITVG